MSFFIFINYVRMLGTGRVNKVFSPGIFINIVNIVTNMKLAFTNVPFRHNLTCAIQKLLRLKRVITDILPYFS